MNNPDNQLQITEKTISLRARLFAGFTAIIVLLAFGIVIISFKISSAEANAKNVIQTHVPTYESLLNLNTFIYESKSALTSYLLTHDEDDKKEFEQSIKGLQNMISNINADVRHWDVGTINQWNDIKVSLNNLMTLESKILTDPNGNALLTTSLKPMITTINLELGGAMDDNGVRLGGFTDKIYKKVEHGTTEIINSLRLIQFVEYTILVLGLLISILITFATTRSVLKYINIFRVQSKRVASGDLTQRINVSSNDELGMLGKDLNTMTDGLSSITKQITDACHHMMSMLSEVKSAVDSQSAGASEQASSINQITASLEEIEKSSMQTIEKAKSLGEAAERTREKGKLGLDAVQQSMNGMRVVRDKVQTIAQTILELSNQTNQIGEITSVVNTLAVQSKMLALNASIEAAKAGEAGKGFAVVAAEVKSLAEQSEQSTLQVQKILEDIRHATERAVIAMEEGSKGVDLGTNLVEQTGEVVKSLSEVIHETTIATQQIEAAIRQEGIGIEQITAGMNEINQVTASSVASVKQTTEAIDSLGTIASTLKKYTDTYKV